MAFLLGIIASFRVDHNQCKICGMEEYERSVLGIVIESLSERNYDCGVAREWRKKHSKLCAHEWVTLKH